MKFPGGVVKSNLRMESVGEGVSLACCSGISSTSCSGKLDSMSLQDDEEGSAMTEELMSSNGSKGRQEEVLSFMDWRSVENKSGLERMGSGMSVVSASGGESDGGVGGEELKRYSMLDQGKLPSSQYKGVVPQPTGRWGSQIYERHQRVWLGMFNREEDAFRAYDRAALEIRRRDDITNFRPVADADPDARFMKQHSKEEIVDMLRKHTYDEKLDHHPNKKIVAFNTSDGPKNEGALGPKPIGPIDETKNLSSHSDNPAPYPCPTREHLFDKAVTPSDVGKLNRLVIPKQHAEKHFPLDVNSSDKGLLLNFLDNTGKGKAWQFRYSYWNSSQSYVLTKGWSRFVKDKKLEAGDIVSFHRGTPDPHRLYITWRHKPCGQQPVQAKANVSFPYATLNPFHSAQHVAAYNPQWMHIFWPNSESPLGHMGGAVWPHHSPPIPLYFSALAKPDMCLNTTSKKQTPSSFVPATKAKEVRLFGVNLAEGQSFGE